MNGPAHNHTGSPGRRRRRVLVFRALLHVMCINLPAAAQQQNGNFLQIEQVDTQDNSDLDLQDPLTNIDTKGVIVSPALRELVQKLDDDSYNVRESAMNEIITGSFDLAQLLRLLKIGAMRDVAMSPFDFSHVFSILNTYNLTLEQRHRLLLAARRILRDAPRGALGIQMQPVRRGGDGEIVELKVMRLLPNLPARRVLQIDDLITEIEGVPLRGDRDLIRYAQVRTPGTPIRLTIRRVERNEKGEAVLDADGQTQYKQMEVSFELGSAEYLRDENGRVQDNSPVQFERQQQAMLLTRKFGTKPDRLQIDRAASQLHNARMAVAVQAGDELVEQHYYIKELRKDMKFIESGAMDRVVRSRFWNQRLFDLQRMIDDPRTSPDDRDFLKRVQRRYVEIINGQ